MYNLLVSRMEFLSFVSYHVLAHAPLISPTRNMVVMVGKPGTGLGGDGLGWDGMGRDGLERGRAVP